MNSGILLPLYIGLVLALVFGMIVVLASTRRRTIPKGEDEFWDDMDSWRNRLYVRIVNGLAWIATPTYRTVLHMLYRRGIDSVKKEQ